jgi:hypothetical protein
MARNTACEGSDGCAAAILERLAVDPLPKGQEDGMTTLSFWLGRDASMEGRDTLSFRKDASGISDPDPAFEVGGWRFIVKTSDLRLIGELEAFAREIADHPRADRKFTFGLIRCTEEGRLRGWAWQKERAEIR